MNGEDYPDSIPMRIIGWSIDVKWSNGKEEKITEIPDDVASVIDDYLTEIEGEINDTIWNREKNNRLNRKRIRW